MYKEIFVPVDNSEHSMSSVHLAIRLATDFGAELVGSHAYAARLHDYRFKQMEFTLPEEYLVEAEMEKQRKIHDSLITMGLELISDSYLVVMEKEAKKAGLNFLPKMYDGKNYEVITRDVNESDYDLVIMGALGLGAVRDSQIGSVCERVTRRVRTDVLVMKNTAPLEEQLAPSSNGIAHKHSGGIVVAIDGSPESFAGLRSALELGKKLDKSVEAISVYDPYLHYAMFNSLVNVLTEKAAKVFKFKEQEQLHEEVIDTGLAKIYQSHLEVARRIAEDEGVDLKITLLDGKAFEKVLEYVRREKPWLLVMGRIGVHSDETMDIGSNTENLLRLVPCNVYLSSKRFSPATDVKAEESMVWVEEALRILDKAPDFAKGIARTIIHRWAMERGHSVITTSVLQNALATILPERSMIAMGIIAEDLAIQKITGNGAGSNGSESNGGGAALDAATDVDRYVCTKCGWVARGFVPKKCTVCDAGPELLQKLDAEAIDKLGVLEGAIMEEKTFDDVKLKWTEDARNLLKGIPDGYQRRRARAKIEKKARVRKIETITLAMVQDVVESSDIETGLLEERGKLNQRAVDGLPDADADAGADSAAQNVRDGKFSWTPDAVIRLNRVPEGFMRKGTKSRIEKVAREKKSDLIDLEIVEEGIKIGLKMMEEMIKKQNGE